VLEVRLAPRRSINVWMLAQCDRVPTLGIEGQRVVAVHVTVGDRLSLSSERFRTRGSRWVSSLAPSGSGREPERSCVLVSRHRADAPDPAILQPFAQPIRGVDGQAQVSRVSARAAVSVSTGRDAGVVLVERVAVDARGLLGVARHGSSSTRPRAPAIPNQETAAPAHDPPLRCSTRMRPCRHRSGAGRCDLPASTSATAPGSTAAPGGEEYEMVTLTPA
jgi:hypothetical protein